MLVHLSPHLGNKRHARAVHNFNLTIIKRHLQGMSRATPCLCAYLPIEALSLFHDIANSEKRQMYLAGGRELVTLSRGGSLGLPLRSYLPEAPRAPDPRQPSRLSHLLSGLLHSLASASAFASHPAASEEFKSQHQLLV